MLYREIDRRAIHLIAPFPLFGQILGSQIRMAALRREREGDRRFIHGGKVARFSVRLFDEVDLWQLKYYPDIAITNGFRESLLRTQCNFLSCLLSKIPVFFVLLDALHAPPEHCHSDLPSPAGLSWTAEIWGEMVGVHHGSAHDIRITYSVHQLLAARQPTNHAFLYNSRSLTQ